MRTISIPFFYFILLHSTYCPLSHYIFKLFCYCMSLNYAMSSMRVGTFVYFINSVFPHGQSRVWPTGVAQCIFFGQLIHISVHYLPIFFLYYYLRIFSCIVESTENMFYFISPNTKFTRFMFYSPWCFWLISRKRRKCWLIFVCGENLTSLFLRPIVSSFAMPLSFTHIS